MKRLTALAVTAALAAAGTAADRPILPTLKAIPECARFAKALGASPLAKRLDGRGPWTVFAMGAKDADVNPAGGLGNFVVAGRLTSADLANMKWVIPVSGKWYFSEWGVGRTAEGGVALMAQNNDGLPEGPVPVRRPDIKCSNGVIHVIGKVPTLGVMRRGAPLPEPLAGRMLDSLLERVRLRQRRGEHAQAAAAALKVYRNFRDGAYSTQDILGRLRRAKEEWDAGNVGGEPVPALTYTILMAGFARAVQERDSEKAARLYAEAAELARFTLRRDALVGAAKRSELVSIKARERSYREAVDLARHCLRLEGMPYQMWLPERR